LPASRYMSSHSPDKTSCCTDFSIRVTPIMPTGIRSILARVRIDPNLSQRQAELAQDKAATVKRIIGIFLRSYNESLLHFEIVTIYFITNKRLKLLSFSLAQAQKFQSSPIVTCIFNDGRIYHDRLVQGRDVEL
jgi:hypothetical protein